MSLYVKYEPNGLGGGGGGGSPLTVGTIDSQSKSSNGGVILADVLYFQTADGSFPGLVSTGVQSFAGNKTFLGTISASNLSGTNTGDITLGTASGLSLSGQILSLGLSSTSTTGALSSTDWNTFNSKQAAGSYITALTGDVTASGPGSAAATLATVNSNVGSFGSATSVGGFTVNAKGLITAASSTSIQITESQVTNLTSDLASKVATASLGNLTDAGTDGIVITGGTGAVVGSVSIAQTVADTTHNGYLSSTDWNTFNSKGSGTVTSVSVTSANGLAGTSSGGATPALTLSTTITGILQGNGTAISAASTTGSGAVVLASSPTLVTPALGTPSALVGTNITGTASALSIGGTAALATSLAGGLAGYLPYQSSANTTTFLSPGSDTQVLTLSGGVPIWAPPATSGTVTSVAMTVPSFLSVSGSPITSSGTLAVTLSGTALPILNGGTGQTTAASAFAALSPLTTAGDLIYENATPAPARLAIGSTGNVLTVSGGLPVWAPPATSGTVTAVSVATANGLAGTSSGGATPALTLSTTITGILQGDGTAISAASTTGSGAVVLATSPTLTTPALGTPSALVGTNITGTASALSIGGTAALATAPGTGSAHGAVTLDSSGHFQSVAPGTSGNVLTSNGTDWVSQASSGGTGTVTSVALSVPATSIFGVTGSPVTTSGTLGLTTTGTSGGIPYFSSTSALSSSALLTANGVVYGGGAGSAPVATAVGTTGQVLAAVTSSAPAFRALLESDLPSVNACYTSSTTSLVANSDTTIIQPTKVYDTNNAYNASTGVFTVPVAGKYRYSYSYFSNTTNTNAGVQQQANVKKNGTTVLAALVQGGPATFKCFGAASMTINCAVNDTLTLTINQNDGSTAHALDGSVINFVCIEWVGN